MPCLALTLLTLALAWRAWWPGLGSCQNWPRLCSALDLTVPTGSWPWLDWLWPIPVVAGLALVTPGLAWPWLVSGYGSDRSGDGLGLPWLALALALAGLGNN